MACLFLIFCSLVYIALVIKIDSEDIELIEEKVAFVLPYLKIGDPVEIKHLLGERYPQDLRKRVYVTIYDRNGHSIARTFNAYANELSDIFPEAVSPKWILDDHHAKLERIRSDNLRVFNVSTIKTRDQSNNIWIMRVAVDHDTEERILATVGAAFLGMFFLAIIAVPASSGVITNLIMRPLRHLSQEIEQLTLGRETAALEAKLYPKEFLGLITSFNQMSQNASQAFDRLESFSADIAHELRNPLNSLRGQLEVLNVRPRSIDEYRDSFGSVLEDVHRLCQLVDSLLFLLRGERKLIRTAIIKIDLFPLMMSLRDLYEPILQETNGQIICRCKQDLFVYAEPQLLQRALINLVENALKYGRPKDPSLSPKIVLSAEPMGDAANHIAITITDNGPGISPNEVPYIFDRLFRSDRARGTHGFGLGLAIVRMIMDLHDGHVEVLESKEYGCTFRLILSSVVQSS